ncbi:MAG: efflux RND transporter periplasmic adaptor subunit [Pseudoxanthomonas sp.]
MSQPRRSPPRPRSKLVSRSVAALAAIAVIAAGFWYWSHRNGDTAEGTYRTTEVDRGDIRVVISSTGTLSATSTVTVGSQVSGQVTDVLVDFNDQVKKDQVIARIDPSTYDAQIAQGSAQISGARAALVQAQATLRNAQLDYDRKSDLGGRQLVARSDVDLARAVLEQARASISSAQAQIQQQTAATQATRINLGRTVIRSPVDGVVLTRTIEPGQTVAASLQAPELFTIAEDLSKMKIELAVDEADIGQVKVGQGVSFSVDAFPDRQFRGTVEQVRLSATTTSNVVTYPVVVSVDNSDGTLLPGLTVNAEIEVSKRSDVLRISNAALRYKPADSIGAQPAAAPTAMRGGGSGITDDLARTVSQLKVDPQQQAAFDTAVATIRERQAARQAASKAGGGNSMFGGSGGGPRSTSGGSGGDMQAQMRQRMLERYQQDFSAFRSSLQDAQRKQWDAAVSALTTAKRAPLYKLVNGKPEQLQVRIGASDGTNTEVSGDIRQGDLIVTGERAAE